MGGDDAVLRIPTEHEEQRELVRWFRQTYGRRDAGGVRIFAIPNGGTRGRAQGGRLKAEGVSAGVPDLLVPAWALWIEMKRTQGGSVSPEQRDWHSYLRSIGHTVLVCRGFLQAKEEIDKIACRFR